jgi:NADH dehydrogenase
MSSGPSTRQRVVVVGGGFGGLACARKLAGEPVEVTLVDSHDYHLFTPLLYQVATALVNPGDIVFPFRSIFRRAGNVSFHQATVAAIDIERKVVRTAAGRELPYDSLVLATGSTSDYFGDPGLADATLGMKTLEQAQRLRNHVLACFERAAQADGPAERRALLTFVIAGGGPTGVEFAGALAELRRLAGREYAEFAAEDIRIVLVEGASEVLPAFPAKLGRYARSVLERRGIDVRVGALIGSAGPDGATLRDGEVVVARTIVWSAGVRATEPGGTGELARSRNGRLEIDERLRPPGLPDVYVIGDVAAAAEEWLPMLSAPAMQQGRYAARAILAAAAGSEPPPPFRYRDKGTMAVIGRNAAVADVFGLQLTGFLGWVAWLTVHLYYIVGVRNRAAIFLRWGWEYARRDRPVRTITTVEADPLVDELTRPGR